MKITGKNALLQKIAALPVSVKSTIRKALGDSAQEMVDLAKKFVPVDDGPLRDSIVWGYGDTARVKYSQGIRGDTELSVRISVGNTKVRYAHLVEFGVAPHVNGGFLAGTQHPGTTKQPFFYPAYRLTKKRAKARIRRAISKAAKEVAKS